MRFLTDLAIELLPRKRGMWRVEKPLLYLDSQGRTWEVPAGEETDGASIPRFFWRVVGHPLSWEFADAAALHDYLYRSQVVSRRQADALFLEAMKARGVPLWRRSLMWAAVRMFGRWSWDRTVWAVLLTVGLMACMSCRSVVTEIRDGREWTVETRSIAGMELSRNESPVPTMAERNAEAVHDLLPRGGWILTMGGLLACIGIAVAIYSSVPAIDRLALLAAVIGGAAGAWGIILMGIAWHWGLISMALIIAAVIGAMWLRRIKRNSADG